MTAGGLPDQLKLTQTSHPAKLQQFLENIKSKFNGLGTEIQKVLAVLAADLPVDIATLFDFDRLLAAFC